MKNIHPIQQGANNLSVGSRLDILEDWVAKHHDHLWWISLPFYKRWFYLLRGFRAPIKKFYND